MVARSQGIARARTAWRAVGARIKWREVLRQLVIHLCLISISIMWVLPMAWMVSTSLKYDQQIFTWPPQWIPRPPQAVQLPRGDLVHPAAVIRTKHTLYMCLHGDGLALVLLSSGLWVVQNSMEGT